MNWPEYVEHWVLPQLARARADAFKRGDKEIADGCLNSMLKGQELLERERTRAVEYRNADSGAYGPEYQGQ